MEQNPKAKVYWECVGDLIRLTAVSGIGLESYMVRQVSIELAEEDQRDLYAVLAAKFADMEKLT